MGQGTSREGKFLNFMLYRSITSEPRHKLLESIRYWKKYTDLQKALSKYILIEVTDFSTLKINELYFCYSEMSLGDAEYVIYKESISDDCYSFHNCDQNTFNIKENCDRWINVDNRSILYRLESLAKARWTVLKATTKLLSLHKRAVISANNPSRCSERGDFVIKDTIHHLGPREEIHN
jgi:hypothetical protein